MPLISLTGNTRQDAHTVLLTMLYPDDEKKRMSRLAQITIDEIDINDSVTAEDAKLASSATAYDENLFNDDINLFWKGICAGSILYHIARMSETNDPRPSKINAISYVENRFKLAKRMKGNKRVTYSHGKLEEYWAQFKHVSHFWSAWNFFLGVEKDVAFIKKYISNPESFLTAFPANSDLEFGKFLSLAAWYLEFGTNYYPPHQKYGYTLSRDESWYFTDKYIKHDTEITFE